MDSNQRTYAIIDISAIKHNIAILKNTNKNIKALATVKADAYGHGAINVAKATEKNVDIFGVATVQEGVLLRKHGIKKPILVLGFFSQQCFVDIVNYNLTVSIYNRYIHKNFAEFLYLCQRKAPVHIAVDTGMSRLGFLYDTQMANIIKACEEENFILDGIFTHFSCADEANNIYTEKQTNNFLSVVKKLTDNGIKIPFIHADNTAGFISGACRGANLVRLGIGMYGINPIKDKNLALKSTMELCSTIADIRLIPKNRGVSYNKTFVTKNYTKLATVAIGYADGLPRAMSNKGRVLINGCYANIIGRVCMDYIIVEISQISCAKIGDKVTIIGEQCGKQITVEEVAQTCDTICYEIFTQITQRVDKIYIE